MDEKNGEQTLAEADRPRLRILLAEDNPANQKLAAYFLRERGHEVEICGDGREAVRLVEQFVYDIILMDVQMPEMDGLEATAAIRQREKVGRRIPIIAMTAHASQDCADHWRAAGMDDCLSKPVKREKLIECVERYGKNEAPAHRSEESPSPSGPFDFDEAIVRLGSDELFEQMVKFFLQEGSELRREISAAAEAGDGATVAYKAHRLKGTVVYLGAEAAAAAVAQVEELARAGDLRRAALSIQTMHAELTRLTEALRRFSASTSKTQDLRPKT